MTTARIDSADGTANTIPDRNSTSASNHDYAAYALEAETAGAFEIANFFHRMMQLDSEQVERCHRLVDGLGHPCEATADG